MRNILLVIIILASASSVPATTGSEKICAPAANKVHCLISKFNRLKLNPDELEAAYLQAEEQATHTNDPKISSEFFDFAPKIEGRVSIEEYFSQAIEEDLLKKRPVFFLKSLSISKFNSQKKICGMLANPLFLQKTDIHNLFKKLRKESQFSKLTAECKKL